jgi:hypothetical protein
MSQLGNALLRAAREREEHTPDTNYNQRSAMRLLANASKKIRTTMIGCVAEIEEAFGPLWGGNKPPEERTKEETDWFELWQIVRKNMLNLGNNQIRAFGNEVSEYTITWNRHVNVMPVKTRN